MFLVPCGRQFDVASPSFDPVKLLPLTYVVAGAFILMSIVIIAADFIKPLRLF